VKRVDRIFGTVVGWLIAAGMVAFAVVGFMAINQATPLSATQYLSVAPTASTSGGSASAPAATGAAGAASPSTSSSQPPAKGGKTGGQAATGPSQAQLVSMGQSIITAQCQACHIIGGKGQTIGPDLDKVMAGQTVAHMVPGGQPTNAAWLTRWIANPSAVWPQATMPNLGLTTTQVKAVVTYLLTKVK
jgi:mono/diheme cytochrome c family protein